MSPTTKTQPSLREDVNGKSDYFYSLQYAKTQRTSEFSPRWIERRVGPSVEGPAECENPPSLESSSKVHRQTTTNSACRKLLAFFYHDVVLGTAGDGDDLSEDHLEGR